MRFRDTLALDEAEVLAGRYKSVSGRYVRSARSTEANREIYHGMV